MGLSVVHGTASLLYDSEVLTQLKAHAWRLEHKRKLFSRLQRGFIVECYPYKLIFIYPITITTDQCSKFLFGTPHMHHQPPPT